MCIGLYIKNKAALGSLYWEPEGIALVPLAIVFFHDPLKKKKGLLNDENTVISPKKKKNDGYVKKLQAQVLTQRENDILK